MRYGMNNNKRTNTSYTTKLAVTGVLAAGMPLAYVARKSSEPLSALCLGAVFICAGFILCSTRRNRPFGKHISKTAVITAGGILAAIPFISHALGRLERFSAVRFISEISIASAVSLVILGAAVTMLPFIVNAVKLRRCSHSVTARCVKLSERRIDGCEICSAVWEYRFGGEQFRVIDSTPNRSGIPQVGDFCELRIDPEAPANIYRPDVSELVFSVCIGLVVFGAGLLAVAHAVGVI